MMRAGRILMVAVAMTVALLPGAASPQSPTSGESATTPEALLARARSLSAAYDYEGAIEQLEAVVRIDPLHVEANELLMSMVRQVYGGDSLEARYRQLVASHPQSATAYYLLSQTLRSSDARETYLRLALQIDPDFAPASLALASRYSGSDQADDALRLGRRAVAAVPGDYRTASRYVSLLRRFSGDDEAITFLKQMTAQYPHELRFWRELWRLELQGMGRERSLDRLRPQIDALRHRFMDSMEHMEWLAEVFERGDTDDQMEAVAMWQRIAERYPEHPRAQLAMLSALNATRDPDRKLEVLQAIEEAYPGSPVRYAAYRDIINELMREERYEEAIDVSKALLTRPDPGYRDSGVGRDFRVRAMATFGTSFECLGHAGWFAAAQTPLQAGSHDYIDWSGMSILRGNLDQEIAIAPQAVAAARSLAASGCDEADVLVTVGHYLARNGTFRALGIELLERALSLHRDEPSAGLSGPMPMMRFGIDRLRELLPYLYLQDGRLDDATRAVDRLSGEGRRSTRFYRIAGEVYEAAGRLEDAKRAYLRALSSSRDADHVRAALDRLYGALVSDRIELFDAEHAQRLPVQATRVTRVHLGIEAPLHRFIGEQASLILLWSPRMEESRTLAVSAERLRASLKDRVTVLLVAVDANTGYAVRSLQRDPLPATSNQSVATTYETLAEWGIEELPTTLLIDAEGRLLARQTSYGVAPDDWITSWKNTARELLGTAVGRR